MSGDIERIENDLVHSCIKLNKRNIIDSDLLEKCKKIDDTKYKFINSNEEKIFGEKRNEKQKNLEDLLKIITDIRKYYFNRLYVLNSVDDEININDTDTNTTDIKVQLEELNKHISNLIIDSDRKLIDNYYNKENSNYNMLLRNYLKIDNNRLELSKIGAEYGTLNRMNEIDYHKLDKSSYLNYILVICLLFGIIAGIVVYILKFM